MKYNKQRNACIFNWHINWTIISDFWFAIAEFTSFPKLSIEQVKHPKYDANEPLHFATDSTHTVFVSQRSIKLCRDVQIRKCIDGKNNTSPLFTCDQLIGIRCCALAIFQHIYWRLNCNTLVIFSVCHRSENESSVSLGLLKMGNMRTRVQQPHKCIPKRAEKNTNWTCLLS